MISVRKAKAEDWDLVEKFYLKNCDIEYKEFKNLPSAETLLMVENDEIIGASSISLGEYGTIEFICVKEDRRGEKLGDGLLRAILNLAFLRGIKYCYYLSQYNRDFFIKMGFQYTDNLWSNGVQGLQLSIHDFFDKSCKSCK